MSLTPHNKAILYAISLVSLLTQQPANAESLYIDNLRDTHNAVSSSHKIQSQTFTDTFETTSNYHYINNNSNNLNIYFSFNGFNNMDYLFDFPHDVIVIDIPRENSSWSEYTELYSHFVYELINNNFHNKYENVHFIGNDTDSSDFITQGIITQYPSIVDGVSLVDGGEYINSLLTQASYEKLLYMDIRIRNGNKQEENRTVHSFIDRGFQNVSAF